MSNGEVTRILHELVGGERDAAERLFPVVYAELRSLAGKYLMRQPSDHTLQSTALVHEAYIRLVGDDNAIWNGKKHFFRVAAKAMRRILIDHARQRASGKRGGYRRKLSLDDAKSIADQADSQILAVHDALEELAKIDEQLAELVELKFFGRFSIEEMSEILGVSPRTVKRLWQVARCWLQREITRGD